MGLAQSLQDLETSDTDSGDSSPDEETGRDVADEGDGEKHEHEAWEEEEGESREENEEFVDASSTSVEAENSLFVECRDSVPETPPHPSPQPEEPSLQEEAVCPQSSSPEQTLMDDGSHEELSPEAEVQVDQTAVSTRPVDGSVETEIFSPSDHCSDSAEARLSEEVESPGEERIDRLAQETVADADGDCDVDITSPVSDSGCDLPSLAADPDVTSLDETVESSSDTRLLDSAETDLSEHLTSSADTEEDLDIPECRAEALCEKAETEQEVREEEQDQEQQPSADTPDSPETAEAHSDASVTHSEDSRPASSDDTLEGLDEDSSTMSESEPLKQDVNAGQCEGAEDPEGTRGVSDAQVGEASDGHVSDTVGPEVTIDTETVSSSDAAEEEPPAEGASHTHTHTLAHADSGDKRQPELECEGAETSGVCVPEETHTLVEQGEVATLKPSSEASSPEQITIEVIGGVTEEEATPLATQALEVPVAVETTQEVPEKAVEEVAKAEQQDSSADEALSSAGEHVDSERHMDKLTAAGVLDCTTDTQPGVGQTHSSISLINREKESFPAAPDTHAHTHSLKHCGLEKGTSIDSTDSPQSSRSSISTLQRDSGSDTDGFCSTDTGEDNVFRKGDDTVTGDSTSEVSVSCSSTDDAASLGHPSSTSSSSSSSSSSSRLLSGDVARRLGAGGGVAGGVDTEEEAKDCVSDVPLRSALLRSSIRSLSPFRRHSWGPGKNGITDGDMNQRSALPSYGDEKPAFHRRSLSWCPSAVPLSPCADQFSDFSLSLEGLAAADGTDGKAWHPHQSAAAQQGRRVGRQESEERGSLVSLTEEEPESDVTDCSSLDSQKSRRYQPVRRSVPTMTLPLTKSVSMLAISQRDIDGLSSLSGSVDYSITEEEPGPLKGDFEGKSGTKVSRTFSYLKNKMYKKTREKDKDRHKEREKETKEKRINGHFFSHVGSVQPTMCPQCHKAISSKEAFVCSSCYVCVHKGCRESLPVCAKVKMKLHKQQPFAVPDSATLPAVTLRPKPSGSRERPRSAIMSPDEHSVLTAPRRHTLMPFNSSNLSKSISISNIAGPVFDEIPLRGLRYLSQSTDSLHKPSKVNESTESLVDEGTDMIDSQLMGEFEADARELEADSWSNTVDKKYLKQLKKDSIKRQDVIYELMQTEMHHVRTLRVMAEVYCKGLQKEVQLETQTLERMFPMLDELLDIHTHFLSSLLERKRDAQLQDGAAVGGFLVERIGDLLVNQFSGSNADSMKRVYGKFCGRHNEAVNLYKEHHAKDKRFQAFIRRKMSSSIVRRMGIPECILLVTQRITKYPVLLQRILQHTRENEEDHAELSQALGLVKEVIVAVDLRVSEQEKRRRLKEIHARTDSKSIMRMKSGQMFAREDLLRGRRLLHDGPLQLKNAAGRLKDVQALLLSDILVFLQEKDQKYVFASLDQRSTVISLQKLIVREVANEERALFLITAGMERPEMVEVHASSKDERNTWMQLLQNAMQSIEKDEDEGIPSETEEDKRLMESKAKELREVLKKKDDQIVNLLQEKMKLFRDMCDCGPADDGSSCSKMLFRACNEEVPKGEPIMKDALKEVETLQLLVNGSLGGAVGQQVAQEAVGGVGPVTLPRRAETFGGFDSHQMNISKNGDREDGEDTADLRRTESDSVLKKGGNANLLLLLKRNSEQVLHSVTNLHDLLASLQAVVVQQDTFIEDQRQALSERPSSSASCSSSSAASASASGSSSRPSSRPNSLIEQERQRSLEKQRQEAAALQRQQAAHAEEKRKRERQWEARESHLAEREASTQAREEELHRRRRELEQTRLELQAKKEDYQRDLERLRDGQRRLERDKDNLRREAEALEQLKMERRMQRTPSSTSEDSLQFQSGLSCSLDPPEASDSDPPRKNSLSRLDPKPKGRTLNPFSLNTGGRSQSGENQIPSRLLQLTKSKDKKDKKKKKSKHPLAPDSQLLPLTEPTTDGEIYFC